MERFEVNILGCGSATPTLQHFPASQVVNVRDKLFMVDCGEGAQLQFRKSRLPFGRLNRIFISHLHGDHCFGLIGFISTLALLGRTGDLFIHAHADMETLLRPQLDYFCKDNPFKVIIEPFSPTSSEVIYEDRSVTVSTIPLRHRIPCSGFLFREQPKEAHLRKDMLDFYQVSLKERALIKQGADFVKADGTVIPNKFLTTPADPSRNYAYCSDTAYDESIIPVIEGVDLLFHEATYTDAELRQAYTRGHATASQAAQIAKMANVKKLMIGHFSARYPDNRIFLNEARKIFPDTVLANEGLCEKL